jgi:hypothetical protein
MERRRELLRHEAFAIVKNMLDPGERPVQACVQKMLSADSLKARERSAGISDFPNKTFAEWADLVTRLISPTQSGRANVRLRRTMWVSTYPRLNGLMRSGHEQICATNELPELSADTKPSVYNTTFGSRIAVLTARIC